MVPRWRKETTNQSINLEKAYDPTRQHIIMKNLHVVVLCGNLSIFIKSVLALGHFCDHIKTTYSSLHSQDFWSQGPWYCCYCLFVDNFVLYYRDTVLNVIEKASTVHRFWIKIVQGQDSLHALMAVVQSPYGTRGDSLMVIS